MKINREKIIKSVKAAFFILAGNALLAFLVAAFVIPHDIIMGGTTGIGIVLGRVLPVETAVIVLILNVILLLAGLFVLGKKFFLTTVASSLLYPVFLALMQRIPGIGGMTDNVMQRFVEIANSVPRLVIVSVLAIFMPKGMGLVIVALLLTEWIGMSKIARAEMLKIKEQEYVLASRTLGAGSGHIIFKEILPNTIGPIITQMMFSIPTAIFTEAFLSFVGVGIVLPQCSIGTLIEEGFNNITILPYQILPPILVLALLMLGFNFIGDGLREALAPKLEDM